MRASRICCQHHERPTGGRKDDGYEMIEKVLTRDGPDWTAAADRFVEVWSSDTGEPDYDALAKLYGQDDDIVIYDSLPPIQGYRGFPEMKNTIFAEVAFLRVQRTSEVTTRELAEGAVVVTSYLLQLEYRFADGESAEFPARISQVWERRGDHYEIVHEHPSTVLVP